MPHILFSLVMFLSPQTAFGAAKSSVHHARGLRAPLGWRHSPKVKFKHPVVKYSTPLPARFSLVDKWGSLPPVRDQGQCGDCWNVATSQTVELGVWNQTGQPSPLSIQDGLSCSGKGSCNGGYFDVLDYFVVNGLPSDSDFPY